MDRSNDDRLPPKEEYTDQPDDREGLLANQDADSDDAEAEIERLKKTCKQLRYVLLCVSILLSLVSVGSIVLSAIVLLYDGSDHPVLSPVPSSKIQL